MTRLRTGAAAAVVAACIAGPALLQGTSAAAPAAGLTAQVAADGASIVTTAHVPVTSDPVHVAREYSYELYATCWTRAGAPQSKYVRKVATGRMPGSAGGAQLRVPPDARTSFTFTDPAAALAATVEAGPVSCPKRLTPGLLRVHVGSWTVTVTAQDGTSDSTSGTADVSVWFDAP